MLNTRVRSDPATIIHEIMISENLLPLEVITPPSKLPGIAPKGINPEINELKRSLFEITCLF